MGIADTYGHLVGLYLIIGLLCYTWPFVTKIGSDKNNEK